jgi:photosynthetic reaction center cytochrome c subunit
MCVGLVLGIAFCLTSASRAKIVSSPKIVSPKAMQESAAEATSYRSHSTKRSWHSISSNNFPTDPGPIQSPQGLKNIQVLKGLPESQFFLVMNFVATSLGVQCTFCHVQQGKDPNTGRTKWVWESDDKPEKQTARRMMQMVLSIKANDKIDFRNNEVTCYTCHRGQRHPVGLPAMPLVRSGHEPGPDDATASTPVALPSVDQVFSKYLAAVGGSAVTETKTMVLKGNREASQDRNWQNEITVAFPDKFMVNVTTPQSTLRQVINGDNGFIVNGTNVRNLATKEAVDIRRSWDELYGLLKVRQLPGMSLSSVQKVNERDAYLIENATDNRTERYYFDVQTGLLLRKTTLTKTMLMPFPDQIDFEDYRDVDGVKVPFTIRYSAIDTYDSWTRKFTEIKRNAVVDDALFKAPN